MEKLTQQPGESDTGQSITLVTDAVIAQVIDVINVSMATHKLLLTLRNTDYNFAQ